MRDFRHWRKWRLVAKLDPDKKLPNKSLEIIKHRNIDAVIVGGTQGITFNNTWTLAELIRQSGYSGTLVQEISSMKAIIPMVDGYLIPLVLNATDKKWLVDYHFEAIKRFREFIDWDKVLSEGYLVCNQDSAVGRLTEAKQVSADDAVAYTILAQELLRLPILYIEYSGTFGDIDLIKNVSRVNKSMHLFYGGGIKNPAQLEQVAPLVDTVVVGNIFYEDPDSALAAVDSFNG